MPPNRNPHTAVAVGFYANTAEDCSDHLMRTQEDEQTMGIAAANTRASSSSGALPRSFLPITSSRSAVTANQQELSGTPNPGRLKVQVDIILPDEKDILDTLMRRRQQSHTSLPAASMAAPEPSEGITATASLASNAPTKPPKKKVSWGKQIARVLCCGGDSDAAVKGEEAGSSSEASTVSANESLPLLQTCSASSISSAASAEDELAARNERYRRAIAVDAAREQKAFRVMKRVAAQDAVFIDEDDTAEYIAYTVASALFDVDAYNAQEVTLNFFESNSPETGCTLQLPDGRCVLVAKGFTDDGATISVMTSEYADSIGLHWRQRNDLKVRGVSGADTGTIVGLTDMVNLILAKGHSYEASIPTRFAVLKGNAHGMYDVLISKSAMHAVGAHVDPVQQQLRYYPLLQYEDNVTQHGIPMITHQAKTCPTASTADHMPHYAAMTTVVLNDQVEEVDSEATSDDSRESAEAGEQKDGDSCKAAAESDHEPDEDDDEDAETTCNQPHWYFGVFNKAASGLLQLVLLLISSLLGFSMVNGLQHLVMQLVMIAARQPDTHTTQRKLLPKERRQLCREVCHDSKRCKSATQKHHLSQRCGVDLRHAEEVRPASTTITWKVCTVGSRLLLVLLAIFLLGASAGTAMQLPLRLDAGPSLTYRPYLTNSHTLGNNQLLGWALSRLPLGSFRCCGFGTA